MAALRQAKDLHRFLFLAAAAIAVTGSVDRCAAAEEPAAAAAPDARLGEEPLGLAAAAVLAAEPATPLEWLDAVTTLAELGHVEAAQPWLEKLLAHDLAGKEKALLVRKLGSDRLLRLAVQEQLDPKARSYVQSLLAAARAQVQAPDRIAARIAALADPDPFVRRAALVDLIEAGPDAAVGCLHMLATQGRPERQLQLALVKLGPDAAGPLSGALESRDERFLLRVLDVCSRLGADFEGRAALVLVPAIVSTSPEARAAAERAWRQLTGQPLTADRAARLLRRKLGQWLEGDFPVAADHLDRVTVWHWDAATKKSRAKSYRRADAGVVLAARLAPALARLGSSTAADRGLLLAVSLEAAALDGGPDFQAGQPPAELRETVAAAGPDAVEAALESALAGGLVRAATAAAEILGQIGSDRQLRPRLDQPAPLVAAMTHGDRRLRFAAVGAVLALDSSGSYRGSSNLPLALGHFIATSGGRLALVAAPRPEAGQALAAMLTGVGFDTQVATSGTRLLALARESADVEIIFIRMESPQPSELLYRLRRDWRTREIPVVLVGSASHINQARYLADTDSRTLAAGTPRDVPDLERLLQWRADRIGWQGPTAEERRGQALQALVWLEQLAAVERKSRRYNLERQMPRVETALFTLGLGPRAASVLAHAGRPASQTALVDLASRPDGQIDLRQAAAAAFRANVEQHGILLTSNQILDQYNRYNASAAAEPATQQLLASILDTLEKSHPPAP